MGEPARKLSHIGRYEVTGVIGCGGMGTVYRATDPRIGRQVAIKVLAGGYSEDPDLLARFYREAKCTGSLQHQNVVTVYELGDQDGCPYLVMQYLEGESLESMISARRPLQISEKLAIMVQVCNGLNYAHQQGVIHRDIKPANIMVLKDGSAKIVDFGIAQVPGKRLTRKGQLVGSFYYMSPEQLNGNVELDLRTDIYSAGVVLFQVLTGVLPFEGRDTASTLYKIVHGPRPLLRDFLSGYPEELETINQRALAKDRADRYASAEEFAFDLTRLRQQLDQEMVAACLQQAEVAIERHTFDKAKQQLMQALRIDTHNLKARMLLRQLDKAVELERRREQAVALGSQAEEACRRKNFDAAVRYVQQALELDGDNSDLLRLRDAVTQRQQRALRLEDAISRARLALQTGQLDQAFQAIEQALIIEPNDPTANELAGSINRQREREARKQQAAPKRSRQSVIAENVVEKAMADARMLIFLNEPRQAEAALAKVNNEISFVSPELRSQIEMLKRDLQEKLREQSLTDSYTATVAQGSTREEAESATIFGQPDLPDVEIKRRDEREPRLPAEVEVTTSDLLQELSTSPRSVRWTWVLVGSVVAVLVAIGALALHRSKVENSSKAVPAVSQTSAPAIANSYLQINAEPWGMVKRVASQDGKSVLEINDVTPVRVSVPAGKYTVVVEGPNQEIQTIEVEVPQQGGQSSFAVFKTPDIEKIVGARHP
jgi:tetratricopeptide (TPR) repeat protein